MYDCMYCGRRSRSSGGAGGRRNVTVSYRSCHNAAENSSVFRCTLKVVMVAEHLALETESKYYIQIDSARCNVGTTVSTNLCGWDKLVFCWQWQLGKRSWSM